MRLKAFLNIFIFLLLLCNCQIVHAQKKKGFRGKDISSSYASVTAQRLGIQIIFPNINKIPFYYNEEELKNIKTLQKNKNLIELQIALENYVSNFGIQNFSRNTEMIWNLGQLCEVNGQLEKALYIYRIALKHHKPKQNDVIINRYDSLVVKEEFVPLEYYYDLVEYRRSIDTLIPPKNVFLNMGELVNDRKFPDYGPTMNVQGNMLIFTKRKKRF